MSKYVSSLMVVDDVEADRYLLKRDLEKIGYDGEIYEAENGQEALDFLLDFDSNSQRHRHFPPEVIFLDINMPLLDGFGFLERFNQIVKKDSRYKAIVIMLFTSSGQGEDIERSKQYESVRDYLLKGEINHETLRELVLAQG